jgi:N-glycosylase/DNA lyase
MKKLITDINKLKQKEISEVIDSRMKEFQSIEHPNEIFNEESSHFLRNIGHKDYAIIDFHIVDLLVAEGLIEKPKTITPKKYLEIEAVLEGLSKKLKMSQAELDLYLWYMETGTVLK